MASGIVSVGRSENPLRPTFVVVCIVVTVVYHDFRGPVIVSLAPLTFLHCTTQLFSRGYEPRSSEVCDTDVPVMMDEYVGRLEVMMDYSQCMQ